MADRPRFFDDLAGVAGGAFSALNGLREEIESQIRARVNETIRHLELVRKEELDAVAEMASNARAAQEAAESRLAALEARMTALHGAAGMAPAGSGTPDPVASSAAAPGTKPPADQPTGDRAAPDGASEVAPAAMPPGSGDPGSVRP